MNGPGIQSGRDQDFLHPSKPSLGPIQPPTQSVPEVPGLSQPQGHSAAGRILSMKNSNDNNGNRTRDLPTCSTVPQPTALQR